MHWDGSFYTNQKPQQKKKLLQANLSQKRTQPTVHLILENNEPTAEDLKNIEIRSKYFMRFSMRYTTPEQAIVGLKAIRELNDDDRASALIQYIDENFPGTVIPLELLD